MCVWLWLVAALPLLVGTAHASTNANDGGDKGGVQVADRTTVVTVTELSTRTVTITRIAAASATPDEMTVGAKQYRLQGCFQSGGGGGGGAAAGAGGIGTIGLVLGSDHIVPDGAAGSTSAGDMSLSLCLKLCAAVTTKSYSYVGVSDGVSCYCGTTLDTAAHQVAASNCTLPCRGNATEPCGGKNAMAVYRLMSSNTTAKTTLSIDDSDATGSSGPGPGAAAGIAVGSVAGFGLLVLLAVLGTRWLVRRRQARLRGTTGSATTTASASTSTLTTTMTSTTTTTAREDERAAAIRDETGLDLRGLDGVVMDHHHQQQQQQQRRAAPRIGTAAANATGAEWRGSGGGGASPLTPRTPRHVDALGALEEGEEQHGGVGLGWRGPTAAAATTTTTTPSIRVHPPGRIAPTRGLGERAWHRRRLSVPFPPAGEGAAAEGDDRRGLPSQSSVGGYAGAEKEAEEAEDPLGWRWTLYSEEGGSARGEEGRGWRV